MIFIDRSMLRHMFLTAIALLLVSFKASVLAKTQYQSDGFCNAVLYDPGMVDQTLFKMKNYGDVCRAWRENMSALPMIVPIKFILQDQVEVDFGLTHLHEKVPTGLVGFVQINKKTQAASFDWQAFNDAFISTPVYEIRADMMMAGSRSLERSASLKTRRSDGGHYVWCNINYFNKKTKKRWREDHFIFYKEHEAVVFYSSPLVDLDDSSTAVFLKSMDLFFKSMRTPRRSVEKRPS